MQHEMTSSPAAHELEQVGLFPLPNVVLLPHQLLPLNVFEPRYRALISDAIQHQRLIGVPRLRPGYEPNYYGNPAIHPVFGVGHLLSHQRLPDGRYHVILRGLGRVRMLTQTASSPFRVAKVERVPDEVIRHTLRPLRDEVQKLASVVVRRLPEHSRTLVQQAQLHAAGQEDAEYAVADLIAEPAERQILLEECNPTRRLTRLVELLTSLADEAHPGSEFDPSPNTKSWN